MIGKEVDVGWEKSGDNPSLCPPMAPGQDLMKVWSASPSE